MHALCYACTTVLFNIQQFTVINNNPGVVSSTVCTLVPAIACPILLSLQVMGSSTACMHAYMYKLSHVYSQTTVQKSVCLQANSLGGGAGNYI